MPIKELAYKMEDLRIDVLKVRGIQKIIYDGLSADVSLSEDYIWALSVLDELMFLLTDKAEMLTNEAFAIWYSMKEETDGNVAE